MSKWVCSKWNTEPKDGEKWEVIDEAAYEYEVAFRLYAEHLDADHYFLPKSDYVECAAPEVWRDVTSECEYHEMDIFYPLKIKGEGLTRPNYRLRKELLYKAKPDSVQNCEQWAFVVEKREDV